jgi:hypothetical protein
MLLYCRTATLFNDSAEVVLSAPRLFTLNDLFLTKSLHLNELMTVRRQQLLASVFNLDCKPPVTDAAVLRSELP